MTVSLAYFKPIYGVYRSALNISLKLSLSMLVYITSVNAKI